MWKYKDIHSLILPLSFVFALTLCTNVTLAQPTDEGSLVRGVVSSFFAAYQRKDVDGLTALWSAKSPDRETFTAEVRKAFATAGSADVKSFEVRHLNAEGASATVKLKVQTTTSGQPASGVTQLNRTLRLVKEDGQWKVSQYEPTERELAANLLAAKTENDRSVLLQAEPDLITGELVLALRKQAETLTQRREPLQAVIAWQILRSIAERIGDDYHVAFAVNNLGINYYLRGENQQALELFSVRAALRLSFNCSRNARLCL